MKRSRVALLAMSGAVAGAPVAAHADVLEIRPDGAEWIAGGSPRETANASLTLAEAPEVPDAAMADLSDNADAVPAAYGAKVQELSARFDLSPALIEALVWQESRWRADARSPVGARGLAQLMPGTARDLGVNPDDPFANLEGGARYLREQLDRFGGDLEKALAAYNAGPGRVERAGGIPRIRETQVYVAAIMGRLSDHSRR
jgi:soluble lytic murein transglycosylase-like protein